MEEASEITRVCAFDRSGLGWSEAGPNPPTPESRLREFEQLLMASGEQAPFIFAGHSQGAQLAWLHAQSHLDQAAGLITVDSTPRGILEIEAIGRSSKPSAIQSFLFRAIDSLGLRPVVFKAMTLAQPTSIEEDFSQAAEWAREEAKRVPFIPQEGFIEAVLHWNDYAHAAREMAHLGDLPLIVIAKGQDGILFNAWGDRASEANEMWRAMQIELASMSSDAKFIIAESSGHEIPVRQPSIVVEAIRALVQKYRAAERD